jgi:flagellar basal body-associated protein FliL
MRTAFPSGGWCFSRERKKRRQVYSEKQEAMMKKVWVAVIAVVTVFFCFQVAAFFIIWDIMGTKIRMDTDVAHYMNSGRQIDEFSANVLPDLDRLPPYEDIHYQYYIKDSYFVTETMLLVVAYDATTYEAEKKNIGETYSFLSHVVSNEDGDENNQEYLMPDYEFSVGSYHFRVVATEGYEQDMYPRNFGMVGMSDELRSIVYLYFYDQDLAYISDSQGEERMEDFVKEYFPYEW